MGITETDDAGLRHLVHEYPKAFVIFTAASCASCEQLGAIVELFATNRAYTNSVFLRLNADQNPVAKQSMAQQAAPFFVTYDQGHVGHCATLSTEQQVRALLHALHRPT